MQEHIYYAERTWHNRTALTIHAFRLDLGSTKISSFLEFLNLDQRLVFVLPKSR